MIETILAQIVIFAPAVAAAIGSIGLVIYAINKIRVSVAEASAQISAQNTEQAELSSKTIENLMEQNRTLRDLFVCATKQNEEFARIMTHIKQEHPEWYPKDGE